MPFYRRFYLLAFLLLLASCASLERRIEQNQTVFNQLPPETQERVRNGVIIIGDSPDAVRIAKGPPHRTSLRQTESSRVEIWRWFTTQPAPYPYTIPSSRRFDPYTSTVEVLPLQEVEILKVEFVNGTVSLIEELQQQ